MPSHGKNADRLARNSCIVLATAAGRCFVPSKLLFDLLAFIHLLASLFLIRVGFLVKMIHFYIRALFWTLTLMLYALRSPQFVSRWFSLFSSSAETKRCYDLVTKTFYRTGEIWTRGEFACAACVCKQNGLLNCWDMKCKVPRCQATARVEGRCCRFCFENITAKGLWRIQIKNRIETDGKFRN